MVANGHLLVTGGPGSGKTTVSILKAARIAESELRPGQKVLFLSFARATVSRVIEAIEHEQKIPHDQKKRIEVDTYHAFFWRILKTHGYLIGLRRRLSILTPPNEAIALSAIRDGYPSKTKISEQQKEEKHREEKDELRRLAYDEGRICFDLFAQYTGEILHGSDRIRRLIATMYPVIIFDEFQDTNAAQWHVVQALGQYGRMIALADPEQRIYDWIGADPERLDHFRKAFAPTEITLGADNHRSAGTDILAFGNDILKGKFRSDPYVGVAVYVYEPNENQAMTALIETTLQVRGRLMDNGRKDWSLAILVPTKKMMRQVSDTFRSPLAGPPEIPHTAAIDMEAAILGAEIIAFLMQPNADENHFPKFIDLLCSYFLGKGGDTPTKKDMKEADGIRKAHDKYLAQRLSGKTIHKNSILIATLAVYDQAASVTLTGDPDKDWRTIHRIPEQGKCTRLNGVAGEVRNLRLLERGAQLRQALSQDWRDTGAYTNALAIVRQAFVREHFATTRKPETGVVVMNMHKAKGKQFDEVIIFEGWPKIVRREIIGNPDRIVRSNDWRNDNESARQNFRVSVTRGKSGVTILTPIRDPCILLPDREKHLEGIL